jgi:HD-GYP domain-containing protein (c-di-GMP phosphodiesterase class II)
MPNAREIWYCQGSPAESLAEPLRGRYALRALPDPNLARETPSWAAPNHGAQAVCLADLECDDLCALRELALEQPGVRLIGLAGERDGDRLADPEWFACLPRQASQALLEKTIAAAFANIDLVERERLAREEVARAEREMEELNRIGVALSATHDVNTLLELILSKARDITGADAGSLYLVEEESSSGSPEASPGERRLRFKLTQNDSQQFPFTEFTMPLTESSMAGYVALHGEVIKVDDVYALLPGESRPDAGPADRPYHFNPKFDQESGYRTRSTLTLPMKNVRGEVLGVLQLINCKRDRSARLANAEAVEREVQPFPERAVRMALSLASQAAVAYENSRLYEDIETLFEGFVHAAVTAIEQRDPTTSGHSQRVCKMTVGLAEVVDRASSGPYAGLRFTPEQMKEIRYAALLHDFGKVGVREEVLVKAKKLYPGQLDLVQSRFDYVRKELEVRTTQQKLKLLLERSREEALAQLDLLDEEYKRRLAEIDDYFQFILNVNEPTVLPAGKFDRLVEIARETYVDAGGVERNLLTSEEVRFLSIPKGSLDPDERQQIESHVVHSFNFLMRIPWTKEIRGIPIIARAHHEKIDGSGYPYQLKGDEIPVQTRMMTICDIFDALSAADRPYKKAVPSERALDILSTSVRNNELDPHLFQLFLEAKIFQLTLGHTGKRS